MHARRECSLDASDVNQMSNTDPLLLDGCDLTLSWQLEEERMETFVGVRAQWLPERASKKRKYKLLFPDGDVKLSRLFDRVPFTVTHSQHVASRRWTEQELDALLLRSQAKNVPESVASIATSLGRSVAAVRRRIVILTNPSYQPLNKIDDARAHAVPMGWRAIVSKGMKTLKGHQGTLAEVYSAVKSLPEVLGRLDERIYSGSKSSPYWHQNIRRTLNQYPEFTKEKVAKVFSVYRLVQGTTVQE